jgi:acetyl-CoA carboxylase alpha subunit
VIGRGGIQEQLLELERRIGEVQASVEREGRSRGEAIARLEHATQAQMQSLQNELTALRHDLARDRERVRSRAGIGWAGIAGFSLGLILNIVGSFMAVGCSS